MRTGFVHDGHPFPVLGRHAVLVGPEGAVLEGSHSVQPGLTGAVDEAAVDPTSFRVDLKDTSPEVNFIIINMSVCSRTVVPHPMLVKFVTI